MRATPLASVVTSLPAAPTVPQEHLAIPPRRRWRWVAVACGLAACGAAFCGWAFRQAGSWLVVEDPLAPAHAIVVLSGGVPYRARQAARIYQLNLAAQVWVSQPLSPRAELGKLGIAFVDESFYSQKVLIALGVPADAVHVFQTAAANTEEEISEIARECRQDNAHRVIIVTSKAHTRRVRLIWHRVVGNDPEAVVRYVADDSFDPVHWWRTTGDALDVVREFLGLANAAFGFPLRPEPR